MASIFFSPRKKEVGGATIYEESSLMINHSGVSWMFLYHNCYQPVWEAAETVHQICLGYSEVSSRCCQDSLYMQKLFMHPSEHAQYRLLNFLKHLKAQGTVESQTLYLYHVLLDTECTAAAKDTEQLIIRYKEKSRESVSLGIQIIIQAFLAFLQHTVNMLEVWQTIWGFTACFYCWVFYSFIHYLHKEKREV